MYGINDVFDYESDLRNPRKGGIEGSVLAPRWHVPMLLASVISTVPFLIYLFWVGTAVSNAWLVIAMTAVVAYSAKYLRFKERPVLDSLTSSAHFTLPALVGVTMVDSATSAEFWFAIAAFFLWGMASHALGAVQDIAADREAGLSSVATKFGARGTTRAAAAVYLAAAGLLAFVPFPAPIIAAAGLGYAVNAGRFWNVTDARCAETRRAWAVFLWLNYIVGALVTVILLWAVR